MQSSDNNIENSSYYDTNDFVQPLAVIRTD